MAPSDPLLGGGGGDGAATTGRKRLEKALAEVMEQVQWLTTQVRARRSTRKRLTSGGGAAKGRGRSRPLPSPSNSRSPSPAPPPGPPTETDTSASAGLWGAIITRVGKAARSGCQPTDREVVAALRAVLQEHDRATATSDWRERPRRQPATTPAASTPTTTRVNREAPTTTTPTTGTWAQVAQQRSPPQPRLHEGLWDNKIIQATQLRNYDFSAPVVVACANTEEFDNARQYFAARGSPKGATFIDLTGTDDKVMVTGPSWPRLATATIKEEGESPPKRRALPSGVNDDQALVKKVFATGAVAYEEEVTCLILVQTTDASAILDAGATGGAFIMSHKEANPPKWILREDDISDDKYFEQALKAVKAAGGRLVYRPKARSAIGIVGAVRPFDGAIQPMWYVHGTPVTWHDDQLLRSGSRSVALRVPRTPSGEASKHRV